MTTVEDEMLAYNERSQHNIYSKYHLQVSRDALVLSVFAAKESSLNSQIRVLSRSKAFSKVF